MSQQVPAPALPDPTASRAPLQGIVFMVVGVALLCLMDALAKSLVMRGVDAVQLIALRSLLIVPVMLIAYGAVGQLIELKPAHPWVQGLRGLLGLAAPLCFFLGVGRMPLTSAVVVFFSSIFMVSLLSMVFLREPVGVHRWAAIIVGYIGVFIAMSPGGGGDALGYLLVLLASLTYAMLFVSGRYLSRTATVSSLVLTFNAGAGLAAGACLPWFWQSVDLRELGMIVLLAGFALGGHFCLTKAFSLAQASLIAPFEYTAVIWTMLLDLLIWHTLPGTTVWLGAVIIIGSGLYVIHREHRRDRKNNPVP